MILDDTKNVQQSVETLHSCQAKLREIVRVIEEFKKQRVWDGLVYVFDIEGHPNATTCYAWSSPIKGSNKRKFYAVLHIPPVESPADAVRAAIRRDYEKGGN